MRHLIGTMLATGALALTSAAHAQTTITFQPTTTDTSFGVSAGYFGGFGADAFVIARNIGDSGVGVRGWAGWFVLDGFEDDEQLDESDPATAGEIYKDLLGYTNEYGRIVPIGVDVLFGALPATAEGLRADLYAGVRYSLFDVTLRDGSGNSISFSSNQFGIGGGVLAVMPVAQNVFVTGDAGINRFFDAAIRISNSDPDDADRVVAPGDPDYADTDRFINQPKTVFTARVGLAFRY